MKTLLSLLSLGLVVQIAFAQKKKTTDKVLLEATSKEQTIFKTVSGQSKDTYYKKDPKMEAFINKLLAQMTLEEKLGQLNLPGSDDFTTGTAKSSNIAEKIRAGKVGGLFNIKGVEKIRETQRIAVEETRLKIPLIFGMDVIHGYETNFPIPLGLASSWDMKLIEQTARVAAQEATADGIMWTFSPMVDISRDPRWGRIAEGSGEDSYLGAQIAKAMVYGYQGTDLAAPNTMMACVKHFALYGAPEAGRDYNTVDMSRVRMYNEYFEPYKAAIEAGAGSVMASFNELEGIPATGNKWLQTEVLRNQWKFPGFIVTDYTGINEMMDHGMGDLQAVSKLAKAAGIDMDMVGEGFLTTLKKSLDEGTITIDLIDSSVKRILEAKYRLGLFEDPYRYLNVERAKNEIFTPENLAISRSVSSQSLVLMENKNNILPLTPKGTIAVIGPLADNAENMPGTWSVAAKHANSLSIFKGLQQNYGDKVKFLYAKGSNVDYNETFEKNVSMFGKTANRDTRDAKVIREEAIAIAKQADVILLVVGETAEMSGESSSRTNIEIPQAQKDLLMELKKTAKPIVLLLLTGRPLVLKQEKEQVDAILNLWFAGSQAGNAVADVVFGKVNPSAKLPITFPRNIGQVPIFYNHKNTGRPLSEEKTKKGEFDKFRSNYLDEANTPLYPFGYGLSYSKFTYGLLSLSANSLVGNQTLKASVTVTNSGKYDGAEVVQLYIRDKVGSITRPVKELKGFQKIFLKVGESKTVSFNITTEMLKFYNNDLLYDWEPGEFEIMIGTNSEELQKYTINWIK